MAVLITGLDGGAGALALRGALALDPAEFEVTVVAGTQGGLLARARETGLEVIAEPPLRTPIAPRHDLASLGSLTALLRRRRFDVVHTHTAKAGVVGRIAAHRAGVPRIVHTYHGFPFHEFQSPARRAAYVAMERAVGRVTDIALCVGSGVAAEAVRRRLVPPHRIRTIGVAVENLRGRPTAADQAARARARLSLGLGPSRWVIGAVGRLTYQKAPGDFLLALRHLADLDVTGVWIGGGDLAGPIARMARRQPRPPVVLAGERSDVAELLPAFDVFALPSRYEGLPTAVVEAMVCGVPVVASAVNAVGDVVIPGETGLLVPPARPVELARAIRFLLSSPGQAQQMAARARDWIGERYCSDVLREALVSAYLGDSGLDGASV